MSKETIGFIGLGLMGHGMAKNIVEKGYQLVVTGRRNRKPIDDLVGRGATEAATPREVGGAFDHRVSVRDRLARGRGGGPRPAGLEGGTQARFGDRRLLDQRPVSTLALAEELKAEGIDFVDAPLSRTPKEAWEGKLDTMVGASEATFARSSRSSRPGPARSFTSAVPATATA